MDETTYTLGLDIGIASVGWCVLGTDHIIDLGVRAFDKAETAKEGDSLNLVRRSARLMRRRLRRRAWRLTKLARLLKRQGLIDNNQLFQPQQPLQNSLWQLRVNGLDRLLTGDEWARVIYHLCKHRGFHWTSRAEEKQADGDSKGESGKVKQGLAGTAKLMKEKGYRSTAEMVLAEFPEAQRNKQGDYGKALSRVLLGEELALLFQKQRELGNPHTDAALEQAILGDGDRKNGLFWAQKPALAGSDLLKMLGKCTFEKAEFRAPKASFTAERHVWLTRLNNLRIVVDGVTRPLTEQERAIALPLPYKQAGLTYKKAGLTYKQLASALNKASFLDKDKFKFTGLSYPSEKQKSEGKAKDPEEGSLVKIPGWQELRNTLREAGLETEWEGLAGAACCGQPEILDKIATVLSVYKDDDEVLHKLEELPLPNRNNLIKALQTLRFDKFHALSLKALRQIVPHMENGLRYDEACVQAGYHHSQLHKVGEGEHKYLPPFYDGRDKDGRMLFREDADIPRNPVVLRALNQARKVVNAIVRQYGQPLAVHIEMARDLSRPLNGKWSDSGKYIEGRSDVRRKQEEFRDSNDKDKAEFAVQFDIIGAPKGSDFEKWRLYREQQGKCAYSIAPIDLNRLLEAGYVEVDHALPYSRSFDDSKNNKVLVLAKENRDKGNRTPYEYLVGAEDSPRWLNFVAFVETNKTYRLAKRSRLLRKDFGKKEAKEFRDRNLNDTRYICRFFKNYVERYLQLAADSEAKRCVVLSGQMTAFLRARWGLNKVRGDSDRHHALDATVVAACSHRMVQRLSDYARRKELDQVREGFVDIATGEIVNPAMFQQLREHFPDPWPQFHHELEARLKIDNPALLSEEMSRLGTYPPEALATLRPLFVSRAPQRRNSGAAHKDTIYGQPEKMRETGSVTQKVPLASLTLKDIGEEDSETNPCRLIDEHRNKKLYAAIRERLKIHDGKGDKAFPPSNPLRKPIDTKRDDYKGPRDKEGKPLGPVVRTVTKVIDKLSGIPVRGGIAKNDSMLRVDVFTRAGKFHLVPVYVHHAVAKTLPNRAVVGKKDESQWTVIDDNHAFQFSLYPNDLFQLTVDRESVFGYFSGININDCGLKYFPHDQKSVESLKKKGVSSAARFKKFHVDVLGNIHPAQWEARRGLA